MNERTKKRSPTERVLSILLSLYPKAFRAEYGRAIAQLIRDQRRDLGDAGARDRMRFWLAVVMDTARSARVEHASALRARLKPTKEHRRAWLARGQVNVSDVSASIERWGTASFDEPTANEPGSVGVTPITDITAVSGTMRAGLASFENLSAQVAWP